MGFDHQGCSDLNGLYWIANIPDRKPVLYKRKKVKAEAVSKLIITTGPKKTKKVVALTNDRLRPSFPHCNDDKRLFETALNKGSFMFWCVLLHAFHLHIATHHFHCIVH